MKKQIICILVTIIAAFHPACENGLFNKGIESPESSPVNNESVNGANIPPVANGQTIITNKNIQANITLAASDSDGDSLTWHKDSDPAHGTLSGSMPQLIYTPVTNYTGSDSFTFHVNDGKSNSNIAEITINVTGNTTWSVVDMGLASTLSMGKLAIGKARDDNVTRIYAGEADFGDGNILEYAYSSGNWTKTSIASGLTNVSTIYGLAIADMGNGVNVYAGGYGFAEYSYNGSWTGGVKSIPVTNGIQWINGFDLGYGKNDGTARAYIADWDRIVEISYDYGNWSGSEIGTNSQNVCGVAAAQGRNDGIYRLYAILGTFYGQIWEYTWNGSSWVIAECSAQAAAAADFQIISEGNGRNDGIRRLYAWGVSGLFEFSYDDIEGWTAVVISNIPINIDRNYGGIVLADGRNDGFIRLYTADQNGVGEYTFSGSWAKTGLLTSSPAGGIAIGNGRNDPTPVNRVYATSGTHVFEYTGQSE